MLFNSFEFVVFLLVTLILFGFSPKKMRWVTLLVASYFFYMSWHWKYIFLIVLSTIVDFFCARFIYRSDSRNFRRMMLCISLFMNLSLLFFFKYYEFFISSVLNISIDSSSSLYFDFLLPVGISFYTFQTMSYTIDVYQGNQEVENNLGRFALFVTYFPQLVAGPIERAADLLHQLRDGLSLKKENFLPAMEKITWGLFKKIVIADRVALVVDPVYSNHSEYGAPVLVLASVLFAIQIYCDFSGYSDMAIGISRLFNVKLSKNFDTPYFSRSITEFWRRWHITLSSWFRDYVYIPLGGNRTLKWRWYYNILITFLVSGIWHGANWTFVVWGLFHGFLITMESATTKFSLTTWIKVPLTFCLVTLGWVVFRADNLNIAWEIINSIFTLEIGSAGTREQLITTGISKLDLIVSFAAILLMLLYDKYYTRVNYQGKVAFYQLLIFMILIFGMGGTQAFIYFQF